MKDSVGKWFKDRAQELNVIPPYEAWENVEKTIEDWPKHWYQSNADGLKTATDGTGWDNLSQQLEIRRNQKTGARNFIARTASIVAVIVLLPLWLMNVNPSNSTLGNLRGNTSPYANSLAIAANTDINTVSPNNAAISNDASDLNQLTASNTFIASSQTLLINNSEPSDINVISDDPAIIEVTTMKSRKVSLSTPIETSDLALAATSYIPTSAIRLNESITAPEPNTEKWSIGQTAIFGSSALLNPLSYRDDAITASAFNISYGLSVSRRFDKNQITGDLLFNDVKSQMVALNTEEIETQLSGITLALQYERVVPIFKNAQRLQPELNFGAGVFGSYLNNASVMSNSNDSYYSSFTYRNTDFGGVLSMSTSVRIAKKLRFNVGARIHSGAINLFEGKEKVPSKFFRTRSLKTGVQAKISYTL